LEWNGRAWLKVCGGWIKKCQNFASSVTTVPFQIGYYRDFPYTSPHIVFIKWSCINAKENEGIKSIHTYCQPGYNATANPKGICRFWKISQQLVGDV